ncbi:MAG: hypothetical protein DWQ10_09060 [Calditrichaeota bacterium]|nr:MAG: hypothetical protein DWQ10_09060 [Calditrichota bacterium]
MIENILTNNGLTTAISGMLIVFSGLIPIAIAIQLFNVISDNHKNKSDTDPSAGLSDDPSPQLAFLGEDKIPEDELAAIAIAVELYRKLHFEPLQTEITFLHGELTNSGWKTGIKYGQRQKVK